MAEKQYVSRVLRQNMAMIVAAYRQATGLALATVSSKFYGNPLSLKDYLSGGTITTKKYDEIIEAIRNAWPKDGDWPFGPAVIIPGPWESRRSSRRRSGK